MADLTSRDTHFEFGRNWADFAERVDDRRVSQAEAGLLKLLPGGLHGLRALDIGCGSGLSALSALRLGAAHVEACDIDEHSVSTARAVLSRFAPSGNWVVRQASVFDLSSDAGRYDVVHSWGVLHHTGDMARAVRIAASLVEPGGLLVVALYARTLSCGLWRFEKWCYSRAPGIVQRAVQWPYAAAKLLAELVLSRRNPLTMVRRYHENRGMRYWNDIHDWLGGYPYESASEHEVLELVGPEFVLERSFVVKPRTGLLGTGCSEFVFRRIATS